MSSRVPLRGMLTWFARMLAQLDDACSGLDRDPLPLGRSSGVLVESTDEHSAEATGFGVAITGSPEEVTATVARFAEIGATRVERILRPQTGLRIEAITPPARLLTRRRLVLGRDPCRPPGTETHPGSAAPPGRMVMGWCFRTDVWLRAVNRTPADRGAYPRQGAPHRVCATFRAGTRPMCG